MKIKDFDWDSQNLNVRFFTFYKYTNIVGDILWGFGLLSVENRDLFYIGNRKTSILFLKVFDSSQNESS